MNPLEQLSNGAWLLTATSRSASNPHLNDLKRITLEFLNQNGIAHQEEPALSEYTWRIRYNNWSDAERTIATVLLQHNFLDERKNAGSEVFLTPVSTDRRIQNMAIKIGARPPTPDDLTTGEAVYLIQYLPDHSLSATRWAHIIPTMLTASAVAYHVYKRNWKHAAASLAAGTASIYECGFLSHLFIERNIPSASNYPVLSIYSELRMTFNSLTNFWTGAMDRDLTRAGIS